MFKKIDEISIDPAIIEGHDSFLDKLNIEFLGLAIKEGCFFPRVDVVFEDGVYRLVYGEYKFASENYGGHSRSRVALDNGSFLECNLWDGHSVKPFGKYSEKKWVKIVGMDLMEFRNWERLVRVKNNLSYLPNDLVKTFMDKNDLVLVENGFLIAGEDYRNPS